MGKIVSGFNLNLLPEVDDLIQKLSVAVNDYFSMFLKNRKLKKALDKELNHG